MASRDGSARLRAITWNGAGAWVMASPARQLKRSRTVCFTKNLRRMTFQCLGDVFSALRELIRAAAGTGMRRRDDNPLARQMLGQRPALRLAARMGRNRSRSRLAGIGPCVVFSDVAVDVFQRQLKLLDQARRTLGSLANLRALQLQDLKAQMAMSSSAD